MTDSKSISENVPTTGGRLSSVGRKRARYWGIAGLLIFAAAILFLDFDRLRNETFDLYQRLSPRQVERLPARLIEIDEASLRQFGPWPWPRTLLAQLAQSTFDAGAEALAFDMIFPEPDRHAPSAFLQRHPGLTEPVAEEVSRLVDPDQAFAAVIGRAPIVLSRAGIPGDGGGADDPAALPLEAVFTGARPGTFLSFPGAISNTPALDDVAAGHAAVNGPPDADGVIRRLPLVVDIAGNLTPSLSLELLRVAHRAGEIEMITQDGVLKSLQLAGISIPVDPDGFLRLHFSPPLAARTISALSVLDGSLPAGALRNTVTIVSPAALGLEDVVATPVASESYGADIHAQAMETILSGHWLIRPEWSKGAELSLALVLACLAIVLMPFGSPAASASALVLGCTGIAAASFAVFASGGYLLDPLVPIIGGAFGSLGTLAGQLVETDKARAYLRSALIEERVQSAKLAGELAAARDIQLGMLPDNAALEALPAAVELRAYLEPAKAVGGDLYDAFMLDDRWLYFVVGDVTGKGVPAALFMALAKALSKSVIMRFGGSLEEAVMAANLEISRENAGDLFVTALVGLLDVESGEVRMCNAGHDNPLILRSGGDIEEVDMDGGPPLCVLDDFPYPQETCRLQPGDTLLVLTDGVTEAKNPAGDLFGHARVLDRLSPIPADGQAVIDRLVTAVHGFEAGGEPTDDLTVLTIKYRG